VNESAGNLACTLKVSVRLDGINPAEKFTDNYVFPFLHTKTNILSQYDNKITDDIFKIVLYTGHAFVCNAFAVLEHLHQQSFINVGRTGKMTVHYCEMLLNTCLACKSVNLWYSCSNM
jgi:hypothetical protein